MIPKLCIECGDMAYRRKGTTYDLCANCLLDQILAAFETSEEVGKRLVKIKVDIPDKNAIAEMERALSEVLRRP